MLTVSNNQCLLRYFSYRAICFICRSTFAVDGIEMRVNKDVEATLKGFHAASKPIG